MSKLNETLSANSILPEKIKDSFCVLPWLHAHVNASGDRSLCCMSLPSPKNVSKLPWEEFKNSSYMKNIRLQMLGGKLPKDCFLCANTNAPEVLRNAYNVRYKDEIDRILELTDQTGKTSVQLKYFDYRSNVCNLSCKMCDPKASSSFQRMINAGSPETVNKVFNYNAKEDPSIVSRYFTNVYANEMIQFVDKENISEIYFAGGEPVIEPGHIKFLKAVKDSRKADKINITYNTNLAFSLVLLEKWLDHLRSFKSGSVMVSIDGTDEVYDYIRHGSDFFTLNKNLDYLISNKPENFNLRIDVTLSTLNLFFLQDLAELCISKKIHGYARMMVGCEHIKILRPEVLPLTVREKILARWVQFYEKLSSENRELLFQFNEGVNLLKGLRDWSGEIKSSIDQLSLYDSLYGEENKKFFTLLKNDVLGTEWASTLEVQD